MRLKLIPLAILAGAVLAQPVAVSGEVYKWRDELGRTHYSQVAPENGRNVRVIELQESYTLPSPTYRDELDNVRNLAQDLAAERQALAQQRRGTQRRSLEIADGLQTAQEFNQPIPIYHIRSPLYPTTPLPNIMAEEPLW